MTNTEANTALEAFAATTARGRTIRLRRDLAVLRVNRANKLLAYGDLMGAVRQLVQGRRILASALADRRTNTLDSSMADTAAAIRELL